MKKLLSMLIAITLLAQVFSVTSNNVYASSEVVNDFTEMKDALHPHLISGDTFIEFNYTGAMDNFESNVSTMINELSSDPDIYGLIDGVSYGYGGSVGNMTVQFNFTYNEIQTPNESASTTEEIKTVLRPHLIEKNNEVELLYTGSTATLSEDIGMIISELASETEIAGTMTGYSLSQSGIEGHITLTFAFSYLEDNVEDPDPTIDSATELSELKNLVRVAMINDLVSYDVLYAGDTSNIGDDISTLLNELANESELQDKLSSYGYGTNGTAGELTISFSFEYNVENNEVVATMTEVKDLLRPALINQEEEVVVLYTGNASNINDEVSTIVNELANETEIAGTMTGYSLGQSGVEGHVTLTFAFSYLEDNVEDPDPTIDSATELSELKNLVRVAMINDLVSYDVLYAGDTSNIGDDISTLLNELANESELQGKLSSYGYGTNGTAGELTITFSFEYNVENNEVVVLYTGNASNINDEVSTIVNELASETEIAGAMTGYSLGQDGTEGNLTLTFNFIYALGGEPDQVVEGASTMLEVKELLRPALINKEVNIEFTYIGSVGTLQAELNNVLNELFAEEPLVNTVNQFGTSLSGSEGNLIVTLSVVYQGIDGTVSVYSDEESFVNNLYNELVSHPNEVRIGYHSETFDLDTIGTLFLEAKGKDDYLKQSLTSYSISYMRYGYDYEIVISPTFSTTSLEEADFDQRVDEILDQILYEGMSIDLKEKVIHDYIVKNIRYDDSLNNSTAYDALITGSTTCNGYAMLAYKILSKAGIETRIITGSNHAWNMVNIDGDWYHLDCTGDAGSYEDHKYYTYYNITDDEMSKMTNWELDFPVATQDYISTLESSEDNQKQLIARELTAKSSKIGLDIIAENLNIQVGKTDFIGYTYSVPGNYSSEIIWVSSDESIVSIENNIITALKAGDVTITAQTVDGRYIDQCQISATLEYLSNSKNHVESDLYFYDKDIVLKQGETRPIYSALIDFTGLEKDLVWISDNPYVLTVHNGVIFANGKGSTTVSVYGDGELVDSCNVTVTRPDGYNDSNFTNQVLAPTTIGDMDNGVNTAVPSIELFCDSSVDVNNYITVTNKHEQFDGMFSLIGQPFEIYTHVDFEYADLTFSIDDSVLLDQPLSDLSVFWYDEITGEIVLLDTIVNEENQTLSARVNHFSIYGVVNKETQRMLKKVSMESVKSMLNPKRLDLSIVIDNKWSEDLDNVVENLMNTINLLDSKVDLKLNAVVINRDSTVNDLGWFTNKSKYKYLGDYKYDVKDFDDVGDFVDLYQQLLSIQSEGYDAAQYETSTLSTASDVFTLAYNKAMNSSGHRKNSDTCGMFITEIDGYTYFEDVKNSIIEDNNGFGIIIQQASNQLFDQYGEVDGQDGVYSEFSLPVVDFVADKVTERKMYESFYLTDFNFNYNHLSSLLYPNIEPILVSTGNNYIVYMNNAQTKNLVAKQSYNIAEATLHLSTDDYYSNVYEINDKIVTPYHFMGQIFTDYSGTLYYGKQNDDVEVLKTMLVEQGLIDLFKDNGQFIDKNGDVYQGDKYDTLTKQTVKYLQMIYGLNVNGVADNQIWTLLGLPEPESEYYKYILNYVSADPLSSIDEWLLMTEAKGHFPSFAVDRMMNINNDDTFIINTIGTGYRDIVPKVYFKRDGNIYNYKPEYTTWYESSIFNEINHGDNYKSYNIRIALVEIEDGYEEVIKFIELQKHEFGEVNLTVYSVDGVNFHSDPISAYLGLREDFIDLEQGLGYSTIASLSNYNHDMKNIKSYKAGKAVIVIVLDVATVVSIGSAAAGTTSAKAALVAGVKAAVPSGLDLGAASVFAVSDTIVLEQGVGETAVGTALGFIPGVGSYMAITDCFDEVTGAFVQNGSLFQD